MAYVDGFVIAAPTANKEAYRAHAVLAWAVFKDYGAIEMVECWGDDTPEGETTSFPRAVKLEPDETVVFGWIWWPSKAVRDDAWPQIMADPRMTGDVNPMPFDGKRMIHGGFETLLECGDRRPAEA